MYQQNNYRPRESRGSMLVNGRKTSPKSPDVSGDMTLCGDELAYILANAATGQVTLRVVGWNERTRDGRPRMSLKVTIPQNQSQGYNQQPQGSQQGQMFPQQQPMQQPTMQQRIQQAAANTNPYQQARNNPPPPQQFHQSYESPEETPPWE